ncbi:outer membrane protein assembly factor BamB family protein [Actinoplanes siamensis]|uniref:Pyrrolo-quinoline quinone repeat domain-containing protein n=1 Tax=Actinoplanes siamensis TaxID=1223317 RepID=A0A919NCG0_9ACTN|nr:PQQ-binding-like beta-propeller repeat protein [Actinoplanes siamensis]GIF08311.1 hypothetical protein Asi03nite_58490 [Actinoplanes siamensis]
MSRTSRSIGTGLAAAVAVLLAAGPALAATPHPGAADWTQDGHDATHDAFNPDEYQITAGTLPRLVRRWSVATAPGATQLQAPIVAGSQLFVADSTGIGAYTAATGDAEWRFASAGPPPVLATDGASLFAYLRGDTGAELVALDTASGEVRWRQPVPSAAPAGRLLLDQGIVVAGGNDATTAGAWAFDAATGNPAWQRLGVDPQWPVADGRILLSRPDGGGVLAADIVTGNQVWETGKDWFGYAADPSSRFFLVDEDTQLLKVRADSGTVVWRRAGLGGLPAIDHDRIYTGDADEPETVVAVDLATGEPLWRLGAGLLPTVAGGVIWISHSTQESGWQLEALDPATGTPSDLPAAVHEAGGPDRAVVAHGWLYTTDGATLRAFTAAGP